MTGEKRAYTNGVRDPDKLSASALEPNRELRAARCQLTSRTPGPRTVTQASPSRPRPLLEGEERFRVLVESVKDYAIFMLDLEGRVQTWNAGAELIKGYTPDEIIGHSIELFYTPEDRERGHPAELLAVATADGRVEEEGWRVRKDGSRFWADVVITLLRNREGKPAGFAKVTRDLSERREAEQQRRRRDDELLRSEERFRILIDAVEDYAIFMLDPSGHVATWNSGAQRLIGYSATEIIGQHFSRLRIDEDVRAGKCESELETTLRLGRLEEESWRVRKDGLRFWANVVLTPIRNIAGDLLGFAKVTRDLTERRRLDEERAARAGAEEAMRLKDEFLSIASHELRTPLTALQIDLQSLQQVSGGESERIVRKLGRAARHGDRLAALVESLLDVTRIATGRVTLTYEALDLSEVISELVEGMRATAEKARCDLTFVTSGRIEGWWDRLRVEQIVTNLLANAFKYGAGNPVKVSIRRDDSDAVLEVADQGPGIPEADMPRIFNRFERAAALHHYGGLGLGLYVARQFVTAHAGTISVRNLPGAGACFTIRLPLGRPPSHSQDATVVLSP
jgi:PAS domain S-box-containing protein